ncbi:hypothetical protein KDL29_10430 [bacterium]|nr:hypothetical protein [bacterium]
MRNAILLISFIVASLALASCGGGGAGSANPPANNQTSLTGQLSIDNGVKGSSALSGLNGQVSVISDSGELLATTPTTATGSFRINEIEQGDGLLKIEFDSNYQLGQDGTNNVEILMPVTVVSGRENTVQGAVTFQDLNNDGVPDGVQLITDINGSPDARLIEPGDGFVRIDSDGDGDCRDEDRLRDLDGDGLPEDAHGRDHSLRGGIIKGPIMSISETELVVNGVLFNITDATRFKDHGNRNPDMAVFAEGTNVHIRGIWNGEEWTAIEVKTTGVRGKGDGDDDDDGAGDDDGDDDDSGDDDGGDDDDGSGGDDDGTDDQGSGDA